MPCSRPESTQLFQQRREVGFCGLARDRIRALLARAGVGGHRSGFATGRSFDLC